MIDQFDLSDIPIDKRVLRIILSFGAFLLAWMMTGNVFAAIILAGLFMWIRYIALFKNSPNGLFKQKGVNGRDEFINIILLLSAAVIKADKRIYKKERELVRRRLEYDFNAKQVNHYMANLELCLKKQVKVSSICHSIKHKLDMPAKLQLLNFLTGIAVSNGVMVDAEFHLLAKIASRLNIPERSFRSILALFKFKRITSFEKSQSKKKTYSKSYTSSSKLAKSYLVLELDEKATDDEVKKAYRRMAKLHHPDRVAHLGPQYQQNAKTKFQKISDAYESIKQKRGFK
jgi:DnaJ like chaperone protein